MLFIRQGYELCFQLNFSEKAELVGSRLTAAPLPEVI